MGTSDSKNYRYLVDMAENAYKNKRYLDAFLVQSCVIEGVIKNYAMEVLSAHLEKIPELKSKFSTFEIARISDELFLLGKIDRKLYSNLNIYRKKRNEVIHNILKIDRKSFINEIKKAYKLGGHMKGFIVEEMVKRKRGKTTAELVAKLEHDLTEFNEEHTITFNREMPIMFPELFKNLEPKKSSSKK